MKTSALPSPSFKQICIAALGLVWCLHGSPVAQAGFFIDVGTIPLNPGETRNIVELFLLNDDSDVIVTGLSLAVQVADSGPDREGGLGEEDGPDIVEVDLENNGALFGSNLGTLGGGGSVPQLGLWTVEAGSGGVLLPGHGIPTKVATLVFDTRDFFGVGQWDLFLKETLAGSSRLFVSGGDPNGQSIEITDGVLMLSTPVPEPATTAVFSAAVLAAYAGYRRWKSTGRS